MIHYLCHDIVKRYLGTLERIEGYLKLIASSKQYWKSLIEDSVSLIEHLKSQINGTERDIKETEEKMREVPPEPEDLMPWLTRFEALKKVLKDLKEQLYKHQLLQPFILRTKKISAF